MQTEVLAPGTAAGSGTGDITVPAGSQYVIGIHTDDAAGFQALLNEQSIVVWIATPGEDTIFKTLTRNDPVCVVPGEATVRVTRKAQPSGSVAIGAFYNDGV